MKQITRRKTSVSIILIISLLLAGWGSIKFAGLIARPAEQEESVGTTITVSVLPLTRQDFQEQLRGFGLARAVESATISAQVRGMIVSMPPEHRVGARIEKGAELLRIDKAVYDAEVARREALLLQAREEITRTNADRDENKQLRSIIDRDLEIARAEVNRREQLFERGVLSEVERDAARSTLQAVEQRESELNRSDALLEVALLTADANLKARESELSLARIDVEYAAPRAPFSGVISARHVNPGDFVQVGQALLEIVAMDQLELPIEVPASQAAAIREGATATLRSDEIPPRTIEGVVSRVSPVISTNNRTVSSFVLLNQPEDGPSIPPGVFLSASVAGRVYPDVYAIPRAAVIDGAIYLAREGYARRYQPNFFAVLDEYALTREDFGEGSLLITSGFERLFDGAPISTPVETGVAQAAPTTADQP